VSRGLLILLIALFLGLYVRAALRADYMAPGEGVLRDAQMPAPALELQDLQGTPHTLAEFRGRVVLIHFWASWCGPCKAELPELTTFARQYETQGLTVLAVNVQESHRDITQFLARHAVPGIVLQDGRGDASDAWGVRGFPSTFLIDRAGIIRGIAIGALDWTAPRTVKAIEILLQGASPDTRRVEVAEGCLGSRLECDSCAGGFRSCELVR
jgi:cytochrome c biogenesis protein CcmG/thiol:disulfide interchange protein DsbE